MYITNVAQHHSNIPQIAATLGTLDRSPLEALIKGLGCESQFFSQSMRRLFIRKGRIAFRCEAIPRANHLADIASEFEVRYRVVVAACMATRVPLTVCTIYNGCFDDLSFQRIATTALTLFNDAIIRIATEYGVPVIDLRSVCIQDEDYANPIEPSSVGGEKIAKVIAGLVSNAYSASTATRIIIPF